MSSSLPMVEKASRRRVRGISLPSCSLRCGRRTTAGPPRRDPGRLELVRPPAAGTPNLHQYAMKRYGTRVWGGRCPVEGLGRRGGAPGSRVRPGLSQDARRDPGRQVPASLQLATVEVPRWECTSSPPGDGPCGESLSRRGAVRRIYLAVGKMTVVEGFLRWRRHLAAAFAPGEEGEWRYLLRGEGVEIAERRLRCAAPVAWVHSHPPENPYAFAYADGTPFFPMGDTCYGFSTTARSRRSCAPISGDAAPRSGSFREDERRPQRARAGDGPRLLGLGRHGRSSPTSIA